MWFGILTATSLTHPPTHNKHTTQCRMCTNEITGACHKSPTELNRADPRDLETLRKLSCDAYTYFYRAHMGEGVLQRVMYDSSTDSKRRSLLSSPESSESASRGCTTMCITGMCSTGAVSGWAESMACSTCSSSARTARSA